MVLNGRSASGRSPHPKKIYWYVTYKGFVLNAAVWTPYPKMTPDFYLTALTSIFTLGNTRGGLIIFAVNL